MKMIEYLTEAYGCCTPIILKDLRIGGKTKTAIRKELSRATAEGKICRMKNGIYYIREESDLPRNLSFESVVELKFIKNDYGFPGLDLDVYGYYSGMTFLNQIGITQQVPAVLEITTNKTSCKRLFCWKRLKAIVRKGKCQIDRFNYKTLQFLDAITYTSDETFLENKTKFKKYYKENINKGDATNYSAYYPKKTIFRLTELEAHHDSIRQ